MSGEPRHHSQQQAELVAAHRPQAIRRRLAQGSSYSYLRDFVYGAIDGAVTTFAVVSGVAGAGLSPGVVLVLGVANLVGDGFSMAAGNYLGTNAQAQEYELLRRMELWHIQQVPEGEREEVRQIFTAHGFAGADLERAVSIITADRERWVATMLKEEHGLSPVIPSPWKAAGITFAAFQLIGLLPLIPFILRLLPGVSVPDPYLVSTLLTVAAFFVVGTIKARFVEESWLRAGLGTMLVGSLAATLSFLCGLLLAQTIGA